MRVLRGGARGRGDDGRGAQLARPTLPPPALSLAPASAAPRPYMASFSCDPADGGGVIAVNPGGVATPAFCAKYNQVRRMERERESERARKKTAARARLFGNRRAPLSFSPLSLSLSLSPASLSHPLPSPSVTATAASWPWPTRRAACRWWRRAGRPCRPPCTLRPGRGGPCAAAAVGAPAAVMARPPRGRGRSGCATTTPSSTWRGRG